jgi:hypothetical protein
MRLRRCYRAFPPCLVANSASCLEETAVTRSGSSGCPNDHQSSISGRGLTLTAESLEEYDRAPVRVGLFAGYRRTISRHSLYKWPP